MLNCSLSAGKHLSFTGRHSVVMGKFPSPQSMALLNHRFSSSAGPKSGRSSPSWPTIFAISGGLALSSYMYFRGGSGHKNDVQNESSRPTLAPKFSKADTTVIYVLGGPGAGKGTQCQNIVRDYNFVHLSAGDLLRAERKRPGSKYGELINSYIKEGQIVPMEITIALLEDAMTSSQGSRFLIDGFPRKMDQALAFEEQVCESSIVLYFECPDEEMLKRLLKRGETSGRVDDNIESIKKRFKTFHETSFPVIQHYQNIGNVRKISCLNTPERVYEDVKQVLRQDLDLVMTE